MSEVLFQQGYSVLMAVKVCLIFVLIYIYLPGFFIKFREGANGLLDKLFITLTHSTLLTIVIVHFLAFVKLYETIPLIVFYIISYFAINWAKGRYPSVLLRKLSVKLNTVMMDWADHNEEFAKTKQDLYNKAKRHINEIVQTLKIISCDFFSGIIPLLVISAAALIRFKNPLVHTALNHIDSYLHLYWVKSVGNNQIYHDGVYPYGFHAIISAMAKLSFIDPYWLIRFIGPIAGVLLLLGVYYFTLRITGSKPAALVALVVYGLVTDSAFPSIVFRQTAALTQEFGSVFILPGLYFLWLYLKQQERNFLILYAETLAITVLIHSYATVYFAILAIVMVFVVLVIKRPGLKVILGFIQWSFIAGSAALVPMGIGLLMGKGFHNSSVKYIQENLTTGSQTGGSGVFWEKLVTGSPFLNISLLLILMLFISLPIIKDKDWVVKSITVAGSSGILYFLFRAREFNLQELSDPNRTAVFFALVLCVLYAHGFNLFEKLWSGILGKTGKILKWPVTHWVALMLCLFIIFFYPPGNLYRGQEEYDAAAWNYLEIKSQFPVLSWTIIGPPEQMYEALGFGWHYEILNFVKEFSLEQAQYPQFRLPIPTRYVFFFVEKKPLHLGREITTADAEKSLEPEGDDPFMQYYKNAEQRAILEAKAMRWIETYRQNHDGVKVYYEDSDLIIYQAEGDAQAAGGV